MIEEQRKQAYPEMERRMAMSHTEVEIPVKQALDRSAMQTRIEQVYQEKEVPQPVLPKTIPVVEKPKPVVELPKLPVLPVTVEASVVPPVIEQTVAYSPPVRNAPPLKKPISQAEKPLEPYLQPKKRKNLLAWGYGLAILIVIVEVIYFLLS
ncbi:hypothetical protein GCM10010967_57920 [Dyadobacter beijingensis]|uniref:Uncharacterized protein n=1 Tax=Dyadobacter beijingensis TaxID=365489 RepID=A0ABQ2INL7_9BACT|nr:hypothetical protein [Dyadobacter beijingensis]GGN14111.1 hypothetical protein GCM10010967_57920 [Dyadobacter beijingensis]